jgi:carbon storage regulator
MLILSRREGESIMIGGDVRVIVLSADRNGVRLGIEAPGDVRILRGEIVSQVEKENERASAGNREWLEVIPVQKRAD